MVERVKGLGNLHAAFEGRKVEIRDIWAKRIVASAGGVLKKEARAIVESEGLIKSRALYNNIVIKRERDPGAGIEQYNLGVRHGRALGNGKKVIKYLAVSKSGRVVTRRQNDPFYWRFLEFGHRIVPRVSGKSGVIKSLFTRVTKYGKRREIARQVSADAISVRRKHPTGFVPATPFIGPALTNKMQEAIEAMQKQAKKMIEAK